MTLDKIEVVDFQSIASGEVELGKFTVFTGPSSSGKSAFLRATHGIARNSFVPAQVRQGAKECRVRLSVDGHEVESIRGKSKSSYRLDGEDFSKVGRTVPPEVEEVLKVGEVADLETTFSTQFDKPFLIDEPGSVAARVLGSLTNVSVLHDGLRETNRRSLSLRGLLKTRRSDLEDKEKELEEYAECDSLRTALSEADLISKEAGGVLDLSRDLQRSVSGLKAGMGDLEKARAALKDPSSLQNLHSELSSQVDESLGLSEVVSRMKALETARPAWDFHLVGDLSQGLQEVEQVVDELGILLSWVQKVQGLEASRPKQDYSALPTPDDMCNSIEDVDGFSKFLDALSNLMSLYKTARLTYSSTTEMVSAKQEEYDKMMGGLEVCPLCGNRLNGECE